MVPFLDPETRAALDALVRLDDEDGDALAKVRDIRRAVAALDGEAAVLVAVREAQEAGISWDDIADAAALGTAAAKWRWQGTDDEIAARHAAGRKRSARPSSVPTDLPGLSVAEAAAKLGISAQGVYLKVSRGKLRSETIELDDGRKYKRVFIED